MSFPTKQQLLELDSQAFQQAFKRGQTDIVGLVSQVIQQIKNENKDGLKLRAIISMASESSLLEHAKKLDQERLEGKSRGPLHGIPVVLKDCIATHHDMGMPTSAGAYALLETKFVKNAPMVEKLLTSGAIIIGKTNLSELCAFKGEGLIDGFSPVGGQTISPYIYGGLALDEGAWSPSNPQGSSTGSAVSVSAGFSLIAIGVENCGSIVQPTSRQALYALKPTVGLLSNEGLWRTSKSLDTLGVMARSPYDVTITIEALLDEERRAELPSGGYLSNSNKSFQGLKIGYVDATQWRFRPDFWVPSNEAKRLHDRTYYVTLRKMKRLGAEVFGVELPLPKDLDLDGEWAPETVNYYEFESTSREFFEEYLAPDSKVRNLADLVQFNKDHAELCLPPDAPDQSWLTKALEEKPSKEQYDAAFSHMRKIGLDQGIAKVFTDHNLDVILAPQDSGICSLSTASGCPIGNVPLGRYTLKGTLSRPFGLAILGRPEGEMDILRFMVAYEAYFPSRVLPERLLGLQPLS